MQNNAIEAIKEDVGSGRGGFVEEEGSSLSKSRSMRRTKPPVSESHATVSLSTSTIFAAEDDCDENSFMFDSPAGVGLGAPDGVGTSTGAKRRTYSMMLVVAKDVTNVFAPVMQHNLQGSQRRRSSVSTSTSRPAPDPYLYSVNLATCNPAFARPVVPEKSPRASKASSSKSDWPRGGEMGSFLSGSNSDAESAPSTVVSPRSGTGPTTAPFAAMGNFFDPTDVEDPFERDVFSPETRRQFAACKSADEKLDSLLAPLRQTLLRQQTEITNPSERKIFGSNVRFVVAAKMWETLFALVRYAKLAQDRYADELFTQRVVRQMAPLCAIRLRQRLKRTRIACALPTITRPTIEVFKADRTFSHFPEEQLEGLRSRMQLVCFFRHEALLYRGVQDDQCFLMERGTAETRDGLTALQVFRRNHIVGALGMMVGEPRIHSVVANQEVLAWVIRKADFDATINHADAKTKNALAIVHEQRQRNIRDVYHEQLLPSSLRNFLLFAGIRDTVLEAVVAESQPRVFRRGDAMILRGGEAAVSALCVIRGRVRLSIVPQKPLSTTKTLQQHVAEAVCLQQSRRKVQNGQEVHGSSVRAAGQSAGGNHLFIMRDERAMAVPSPDGMCSNRGSRGGPRPPPIVAGGSSETAALSPRSLANPTSPPTQDDNAFDCTSHSAGLHASIFSEGGEHHSPGMACDIACPVLISLPQAVEHSSVVFDNAMERRLRKSHNNCGSGGVDDVSSDDDGTESSVTHSFSVTVLSESVDCLLLSGDKLRAVLRTDRETTNAFNYNLTCLALPFIKPLPKAQLLKTLFPPAFAFGFLPKLALHKLAQIPIVFAPNDIITSDDVQDGNAACVVIVYKGELVRSDAAKLCAPVVPYLWPEISFGCTPGAKAITKAITPIEGVLIRRHELVQLVHSSLRGNDKSVLLDSLKAHFTARVGRKIAGVPASVSVSGAELGLEATQGGTSQHGEHAGNRRIRAALFGTTDEIEDNNDGNASVGPRSKSTRINPLIRAELNAIHLPKYPDRSCTLETAVQRKCQSMQRRNDCGVSVVGAAASNGEDSVGASSPSNRNSERKLSLNSWLSQAQSAVGAIDTTSGCMSMPTSMDPPPVLAVCAPETEVVKSLSGLFEATVAPVPPLRPPATREASVTSPMGCAITASARPLQHTFFIESGARVRTQRGAAPTAPCSVGLPAPHNIPKALLPPSVLKRRQEEIVSSLCVELPRTARDRPIARSREMTSSAAAPLSTFQPTCASSRRILAEHHRRDLEASRRTGGKS